VKVRLKNKRSARRKSEKGDAIAFFIEHKMAPRIALEQLEPYNPMNVVPPKFAPPDLLPTCEC
jgi:hypothetical protein